MFRENVAVVAILYAMSFHGLALAWPKALLQSKLFF